MLNCFVKHNSTGSLVSVVVWNTWGFNYNLRFGEESNEFLASCCLEKEWMEVGREFWTETAWENTGHERGQVQWASQGDPVKTWKVLVEEKQK